MSCVWFCNPSGESSESLLSLLRLFTWRRWFLQRYKGEAVGRNKGAEIGKKAERQTNEGRKGVKGKESVQQSRSDLQVFSSSSLLLFLPHRRDLDVEECAPCSVSEGNRREKEELHSLTHFSILPTVLVSPPLHSLHSKHKRHRITRPKQLSCVYTYACL